MIKKTILIVEDDSTVQHSLETILGEKYNLIAAPNGLMALNIITRQHIDIILLDIKLPIIDGETLALILNRNEKWKNIPIIFISGYGRPSYELLENVKGFLGKPITEEELNYSINYSL